MVSVHRRGIKGKCPVVGMRNAERDNRCLGWVSGVKSDMPKEVGVGERDRQEGGSRAGGVKQQRVQDRAVRRVHQRGQQTEEVRAGAELMSDGLVTRTLSPCPTQGHLV